MSREDPWAKILIRATEEQKAAWETAAKRCGLNTADWIRYTLGNASRTCADYVNGTRVLTIGDTVLSGRPRDRVGLDSLSSTGEVLYTASRIAQRQQNPKAVYDFIVLLDELCFRAFSDSLGAIYCPRSAASESRGNRQNVTWPHEEKWRR